jgi:threonine 3-dehydrogenase
MGGSIGGSVSGPMRGLVKAHAGPGLELRDDLPTPDVGAEDVLIAVQRMAICGTDLHIADWDDWAASTVSPPVVLGHEFMGVVAAVGERVSEVEVGDRVTAEGHITCGRCRNCRAGRRHLCRDTQGIGVHRDGGFAEFVSVPAFNVYRIPEHIDDDTAAVLDPLGNAVHTALTFDLVGEDVLITGAGPIGLMAIRVAQRAGARNIVISDVSEPRLELARRMGAARAVNVSTTDLRSVMGDVGMVEGFDVGLEMSGAPAGLAGMVGLMNHGGRIALLGLLPDGAPIDWSDVIFKGLTLQGIYGRKMFDTWYKTAALLEEGLDISPILTARYPISEHEAAFDALRRGEAAKILMTWND